MSTDDQTAADACAKVNCICDRVEGWPKQNNGWWQHLHAEEPRLPGER